LTSTDTNADTGVDKKWTKIPTDELAIIRLSGYCQQANNRCSIWGRANFITQLVAAGAGPSDGLLFTRITSCIFNWVKLLDD